MLANLFVILQYLLPKHWLTSLVYRIARINIPRVKNFLIARFVQIYDVDVEEIKLDLPDGFATL
ncbi:MAG: phosphatidylserine decarboxylase, partial [Gammaproteobacteria bacterium]|nr:phosphatidylserine decarboxylase [Gammaproteobacteria bacterium]